MCLQIESIFKYPQDATAVLFLVENSDLMMSLQHSLRESHLLMILNAVTEGRPTGSVSSSASAPKSSDHTLPGKCMVDVHL